MLKISYTELELACVSSFYLDKKISIKKYMFSVYNNSN